MNLVDGAVPDRCRRRVFSEIVAGLPLARRPDRSLRKSAATVGAHVMQHMIDAARAEGAFIRADARLRRFGRQRFIAILAGRAQFEHTRKHAVCLVGQVRLANPEIFGTAPN